METIEYKPKGVCSRKMTFVLDGEIIKEAKVVGGCPGNLAGICSIIKNKNYKEVVEAFDGIRCGLKSTSCPDQMARCLKEHFGQK